MLQMVKGINKFGTEVSYLAEVTGKTIRNQDEVIKYFISTLGTECHTLTDLKIHEGRFIYSVIKHGGRKNNESVTYRWSNSKRQVVREYK